MVAGTRDAVLMVAADELSEDVMLGAVMYGRCAFQKVIDMIISLAVNAPKSHDVPVVDNSELKAQITKLVGGELEAAYQEADKVTRQSLIAAAKDKVMEELLAEDADDEARIGLSGAVKSVESDIVRGSILKTQKRIDGRGLADVRAIESEVGVLPRAHGSALFTRGETQAIVVATLGTGDDEQFVDALEGTYKENFLLHYNFPPYSVGETGRVGFTGRREIGHSKLAWRALKPMHLQRGVPLYVASGVGNHWSQTALLPWQQSAVPHWMMMDAGVPIAKPVAGIAMGLIKEGDDFAVLSFDILGDEDHLGDMDFKVAGTNEGITTCRWILKSPALRKKLCRSRLTRPKRRADAYFGRNEQSLKAKRAHRNG